MSKIINVKNTVIFFLQIMSYIISSYIYRDSNKSAKERTIFSKPNIAKSIIDGAVKDYLHPIKYIMNIL